MKKFFILLLIFALFIGCVNAEDVDLNESYVDDINIEYAINENYMYSDNLMNQYRMMI